MGKVIGMGKNKIVPKATLERYPIYLKALRRLKSDGLERVMSKDLSDYTGIEPTTIRRDFSFLGSLGKQGYGYDIENLIEKFNHELGLMVDEKIILVGAGNLGRALMNYNVWNNVVGEIVCAFDIEPRQNKFGIPVYHIDELKEKMPEDCRIAILTVSTNVQETVDKLVECGILGIVDFTHEHILVPKSIIVKPVDVVSTIQEMIFETNKRK